MANIGHLEMLIKWNVFKQEQQQNKQANKKLPI